MPPVPLRQSRLTVPRMCGLPSPFERLMPALSHVSRIHGEKSASGVSFGDTFPKRTTLVGEALRADATMSSCCEPSL